MNKTEFLKIMEERLSVLEAQERKDMLSEYEQHIEWKMKSGMSEKEAIEDFGDVDSLIEEILEAYHIDPSYKRPVKKSAAEGIGEKASGVFSKSKQSFASFIEQKKEKQEQRMEQKRKEDANKPPRWKNTETIKNNSQTGKIMLEKIWKLIKKIFCFCVKILLLFIAAPLVCFSLLCLFGLGAALILLTQGYPLTGAVLFMAGGTLSCGAASLFVLTFIVGKWYKRKDVEA